MRVQTAKAGRAVKFAYRQVGKPYRWGGAGPRTYDCSGLVMAAWRKGGLKLPHRADLQHRMIRRKVGLKHLRPGDLVFFSGDHHVGIYVGRRHFLHAPHTGARVQRGTLTGWRLRTFAGAARPGAPTYHAWPHWVRALAHHHDEHGNAANRPHGHAQAAPVEPDVTLPDPEDTPAADAIPEFGDGAADQASGTNLDPAQPPVPAPVPAVPAASGAPAGKVRPAASATPLAPVASPSASAASPSASAVSPSASVAEAPVARPSTPPVAGKPVPAVPPQTAERPAAHEHGGLAIPLLSMSAPAAWGRHHTAAADDTPAPRPKDQGGTQPRRHRPRTSVRQENDEQRFNRDFDDTSGGADDSDSGNDGLDLRSLLGVAP